MNPDPEQLQPWEIELLEKDDRERLARQRSLIECTTEVRGPEGGRFLRACDVSDWITRLPEGAILEPIMFYGGTQRDPEETLIGLRAGWSEQR